MGREGAKTVLQPGNRSSPLAPASSSAAGTRLGISQAGTHSDPGSQGQLSPLDKGGNGLEGSDRLPQGRKDLTACCLHNNEEDTVQRPPQDTGPGQKR